MINLLRKKYDMMLATLSRGGAPRAYYTELEYLENTGSTVGTAYPATQYIDTGIVPANTIISGRIKYCYTEVPLTDAILGGTTADNSSNVRIGTLSGKYRIKWNNQGYTGTTDITAGQIFEDEFNTNTGFYSNGTQVISTQYTSVAGCKNSIYLFTDSTGSALGYNKSGKRLYYCQIYQDGVLVRDFIPVLDWNYVPCMYDKVTGQLFYNQGTGTFSYGREIHEVEYIESTGTQYIDTGFIPTTATTASISFNIIKKLSANYPAPMYCGNAYNAGNTYGFSYNVGARCFNAYRGSKINVHAGSQINYDTFYNVILSPTLITVKDVNGSTLASADMDGTYQVGERSLYLFTGNTTTTDLAGIADIKLYACQIWDNNVLVRDFIPIVDENFNGYLFDKVNRKIYENAGTGSFGVPDIEVEYIESTGTQYFDTGYTQTPNTGLSVDCAFTDLSAGRFGSVKLVGSNTYRFYFGVLDNKWIGAANNISPNHGIAAADYNRHQFDLNATGLYIDGELKVAPSNNYPLTTITLFNLNTISIPVLASAKLYSCTIGESGVLVKNYIPIIHNGVACLKNTVNDTYLTNAGTGDFVVGKIKEKV